MRSDDIGHAVEAPLGAIKRVVDFDRLAEIRKLVSEPDTGEVTISKSDLMALIDWVERCDHLHCLDHSVAEQWRGSLDEIDARMFPVGHGHTQAERLRRLARLLSMERHPGTVVSIEQRVEDMIGHNGAMDNDDRQAIAAVIVDAKLRGAGFMMPFGSTIVRVDPATVRITAVP